MKTKTWVLLISLSFLYSCEPYYDVVLTNNSGKTRCVKFIGSDEYKIEKSDSITIAESPSSLNSPEKRVSKEILIKDMINHSFTFYLDSGQSARLQSGIGFPDMNQRVVIDNSDTILLKTDRRIKRKRPNFKNNRIIITVE